MQTDGIEVASVGNTIILHESCLVEAVNLKAAIQFNMKNCINFEHFKFKIFYEIIQIICSECSKRSLN
jgi:hypothetical protein